MAVGDLAFYCTLYLWLGHEDPKRFERQIPRGQINTIYLYISLYFETGGRAEHEGLVGCIWPGGPPFENICNEG